MQTLTPTAGQLCLLDEHLQPLQSWQPVHVVASRLPLDEQFKLFHAANPQVYELFRALTRRLVQAGRRKVGAKMVWERIRWEYALATEGDAYKLNNNLTSRYARLVMEREPDLAGIFETRELRS